MTITLFATCKSALLTRSSASVSVCPPSEAYIAQVHPSYFKKENKMKRLNNDVYIISHMHVSFVCQKQRECLRMTAL
jgi:hypothetical protein